MQDAYIVAAVRTPVGKAPRGAFARTRRIPCWRTFCAA
jgi:acetyl-CoA acetyltransferase